jgi:hypothetical protein
MQDSHPQTRDSRWVDVGVAVWWMSMVPPPGPAGCSKATFMRPGCSKVALLQLGAAHPARPAPASAASRSGSASRLWALTTASQYGHAAAMPPASGS